MLPLSSDEPHVFRIFSHGAIMRRTAANVPA